MLPPRHPGTKRHPPTTALTRNKIQIPKKNQSLDPNPAESKSNISLTRPPGRRKRKSANVRPKASVTSITNDYGPLQEKANEILELLQQPVIDLWKLREYCFTEGGLIHDDIRKKVWPKLLGIQPTCKVSSSSSLSTSEDYVSTISVMDPTDSNSHKYPSVATSLDSHQISLDVARCTWHLLSGSQRTRRNAMQNKHKKKMKALLKKKQRRLENYINLTLIRSYGTEYYDNMHSHTLKSNARSNGYRKECLRYYQGFHDVSSILLSTLGGDSKLDTVFTSSNSDDNIYEKAIQMSKAMGLDLPTQVLVQLSQSHLKDMMRENFDYLTKAMKLTVFPLILELDWEVHDHLVDCDITPFFCLSWILTWFSHDVRDTPVVKRLFDVFIASHPLMPFYFSIAMVLHPTNRREILSTECDFAAMHKTLSELPMHSNSIGWKFVGTPSGGGEYVDDDFCDGSVAFTADDDISLISQDVYREEIDGFTGDDEDSIAPSLANISSLSGSYASRVPFQELIDLAIVYMRRIPPRSLIKLSRCYYDSETMKQLSKNLEAVTLLHDSPPWSVTPTAESDHVIWKRRMTSRSMTHIRSEKQKIVLTRKEMLHLELKYPHSFIASGIGPDGDREERRRKRRRKMMRTGSIMFGFASMIVGLMYSKEVLPWSFSSVSSSVDLFPVSTSAPGRSNLISDIAPSTIQEDVRLATIDGVMDMMESVDKITRDDFVDHSSSTGINIVTEEEECIPHPTVVVIPQNPTYEELSTKSDNFFVNQEALCGLFCKYNK